MTPESLPEPLPAPVPRRPGKIVPSWIVIILMAGVAIWFQTSRSASAGPARGARVQNLVMQVQTRHLVGIRELMKFVPAGTSPKPDVMESAKAMDTGPPEQRFVYAILLGEISGEQAARDYLNELDGRMAQANVELSPDDQRARILLGKLYEVEEPTPEEADFVRHHLGWAGRLAVSSLPDADAGERDALLAQALRTALVITGAIIGFGLLALIGLVVLLVVLNRLARNELTLGMVVPSGRGGIYAETFALWMTLFFVLSLVLSLGASASTRLLFGGLAMLLSAVLSLGWPSVHGVPWTVVREDIGLTAGRRPIIEVLLGFVTYAMTLPLMAGGLVLALLLNRWQMGPAGVPGSDNFSPMHYPTHPIVDYLIQPNWGMRLQIFFLASVIAPLVEETLFRGVLYRHLRDAGWRWPRLPGFLFAALVVSLLFAAVHPQGWTTIPALAALALGFTLAREWRGSLIPAMIAHGLNNSIVLALIILAAGE